MHFQISFLPLPLGLSDAMCMVFSGREDSQYILCLTKCHILSIIAVESKPSLSHSVIFISSRGYKQLSGYYCIAHHLSILSFIDPSVWNKIRALAIQQNLLDWFTWGFVHGKIIWVDSTHLFHFYSICYVYQNRWKTDDSLMYLIALATACSRLQTLLQHGLMLILHPIIDFLSTVVSYNNNNNNNLIIIHKFIERSYSIGCSNVLRHII